MMLGRGASRDAAPFAVLAERVLQIDASSPTSQRVAAQLAALGANNDASSAPRTRMLLDSIATALTELQVDMLRPAAGGAWPTELRRLQSNLDISRRRIAGDSARRASPRGRP